MTVATGMGTATGTATAAVAGARLPWDVPVRLVPTPPVTGVRRVHRVDAGVDLPGVSAVEVVTCVVDGSARELLTDVRPVRDAGVDGTLADILGTLCDDAVTVAVDGTTFTRDVLAALVRVPVGERRTYAGLASAAGRPRAVRAVASVMARNRVPLVLPCHRIVPSGGGTGRYGWGDAVKVALLDAEARAAGQRTSVRDPRDPAGRRA